ncbi:NB-ARC domains-containing protein [Tanacetum coccineum]
MSLQMHELIQSMAREIVREKFDMPGNRSRLWISLEFHDSLSENKVTEEVEVLVVLLKNGQKITVDGKAFTRSLDFLSDELRLFYWHGFPFKYLPSDFYPQNIVAIDLSYSQIKHIWKTPKCFRRLKVMNLSYCCNLTTTPDFSEITNLEELSLEGCVNLVSVHPSMGMLKRLVVLNLRDCKQLQNFPSRVEMDALQVLNLTGCLKVNQLPEALGKIKSLKELHADRTAITEVPSFVSSLINLESLSLGGQGRIQPRWWTWITAPFGLLSKQQHPQRPVSLAGLHMLNSLSLSYCNLLEVPESIGGFSCLKELNLKGNNFTSLPGTLSQLSHLRSLDLDGCKKLEVLHELPPSLRGINASDCTSLRSLSLAGLHMLEKLNFSYCNLEQVPESIGGLPCLWYLNLKGNNFTSLPGSLSQLSHLGELNVSGCRKLEVLPELPPSVWEIDASDCTTLREVLGSSKDPFMNKYEFRNCPNLFKNVTIDSEGCISKTECLDSSITSHGTNHRLSAFLGYVGLQTNRCEFFLQDSWYSDLDIVYHGNSMPEWFTNRSRENHVKVELPSDWCYDKFRGYGTCVVFKCKKPFNTFKGYYYVNNFDGAYITKGYFKEFVKREMIGTQDSYMICLGYTRHTRKWKEAKNFVTFSVFEENNEDYEVKECGVRLICDEDIQQGADLSMLHGLPTPTQHGGMLNIYSGKLLVYNKLFI